MHFFEKAVEIKTDFQVKRKNKKLKLQELKWVLYNTKFYNAALSFPGLIPTFFYQLHSNTMSFYSQYSWIQLYFVSQMTLYIALIEPAWPTFNLILIDWNQLLNLLEPTNPTKLFLLINALFYHFIATKLGHFIVYIQFFHMLQTLTLNYKNWEAKKNKIWWDWFLVLKKAFKLNYTFTSKDSLKKVFYHVYCKLCCTQY